MECFLYLCQKNGSIVQDRGITLVKFISVSILSAICALGFGQNAPVILGKAVPIDIHVVEAQWQPAGNALIYKREEETGFSLGVYGVGHREGRVVIPIQKDDSWDINWLADSNSALLVIRGVAAGAKTKSTQIRIYLVDGNTQTAKQLFDQIYDDKVVPSVEVEPSPGLKHAIVTFRASSGSTTPGAVTSHHMVLTKGGAFVASPDLDKAEKDGLSGPNWSLDGTAIYSNLPQNSLRILRDSSDVISNGDKVGTISITDGDKQTTEEIRFVLSTTADTVSGASDLATVEGSLKLSLRGMTFRMAPPMPKSGTSVLELMPVNPILRPVRFRGSWVYPNLPEPKLVNQNQSIVLRFDQSNAQDNSVWLTNGTAKGSPATLVAVHASETWLSNARNSVAYVIDGALFFRSIGGK
jgi:hypothetical protein